MLIIEPRAGLCNRMRVVDGGRAFAKAIDHPLTVVWRLDQDLGASFGDLFEPLVGIASWYEFDCRTGAGRKAREGLVNEARADLSFDAPHVDALLRQKFAFLSLKDVPILHIEACSRFHNAEKPFADFTPKPHLRERIAAITSHFNDTIGIHIRRNDSHASIEESPTEDFLVRMSHALEQAEGRTFFVATDDPREEGTLAAVFPRRVIRQPKRSCDRSRLEAIEDAVVDLYCLAATQKVFGSYFSSFSETAAALGAIPLETIRRSRPAKPPSVSWI